VPYIHVLSEPGDDRKQTAMDRLRQIYNWQADPWAAAVQIFGGRYVTPDPARYPHNSAGFQKYLDDSNVWYFTAQDLLKPYRPSVARACGYSLLLPPHTLWPHGVALAKLADTLTLILENDVQLRTWWRPKEYNDAIRGGKKSAHLTGHGILLEFATPDDLDHAVHVLGDLEKRMPWLQLDVGVGARLVFVGMLGGKGPRAWDLEIEDDEAEETAGDVGAEDTDGEVGAGEDEGDDGAEAGE
jgi:hypothetical protein